MRMRIRVLFLAAILLPGIAAAALPPDLQQRVETLARESDAIAKQRVRWEGVQKALLAQKQAIEAAQNEIAQQQDALNARGTAHNQQAAAQQQHLQKGGCGKDKDDSGVSGGDLGTAQCNKDAKQLNANTADINTEAQDIQSQQATLEARYAKANQDASDWNAHESQATEQLNLVYRSMNDWLDRAYPVIADTDFRDEVSARGADASCANNGLPESMSIGTAKHLAEGYRKCFKSVLAAQHDAPKAQPAASTH